MAILRALALNRLEVGIEQPTTDGGNTVHSRANSKGASRAFWRDRSSSLGIWLV